MIEVIQKFRYLSAMLNVIDCVAIKSIRTLWIGYNYRMHNKCR